MMGHRNFGLRIEFARNKWAGVFGLAIGAIVPPAVVVLFVDASMETLLTTISMGFLILAVVVGQCARPSVRSDARIVIGAIFIYVGLSIDIATPALWLPLLIALGIWLLVDARQRFDSVNSWGWWTAAVLLWPLLTLPHPDTASRMESLIHAGIETVAALIVWSSIILFSLFGRASSTTYP